MKKISIIIILLLVLFVTGCEKETKKEVVINGKSVNTSKMEHKYCTREGTVEGGEVSLSYDIYYTNDVLNIIKSIEKVTLDDSSMLDTYEEAYKKVHSYYEGLDYYDTSVVRNNNTVTSTININYDEIDIDKLISIEGEEDNIFTNKVPSVSKWLALGKKFGIKCELVEE